MTGFTKIRAGHWRSLNSGWRIETRGPGVFALVDPDRRVAGQETTLEDAMAEVRRREAAES